MITVDKCELMGDCALKIWIIHGFIIGSPIFFCPKHLEFMRFYCSTILCFNMDGYMSQNM